MLFLGTLKYYTTVTLASAILLEQIFAQAFGLALGLDHWPGILTYVGGAITAYGLYHQSVKQKHIIEYYKSQSIIEASNKNKDIN